MKFFEYPKNTKWCTATPPTYLKARIQGTLVVWIGRAFPWLGNNLKRITTGEGQYIYTATQTGLQGQYQYYLNDHLGNTRVVVTDSGKVLQRTDYYAFGLQIPINPSTSDSTRLANKYLYNGKELQPETGLLDYGARQYDPAGVRWFGIDPLAEKMSFISPYSYGFNNPIKYIDRDGRVPSDFYDKQGNLVTHVDDGSNATYTQTGRGTSLHYEFSGFKEQGGRNEVNLVTAIQEAQNLNMSNSSLEPGGGATYCNFGCQNVLATVASATGEEGLRIKGSANDMTKAFESNPALVKVSREDARAGADNLSVTGIVKSGHGHVTTYSAGGNKEKGVVANIGIKNGFYPDTKSSVIGAETWKQTKFFTLSPNVNPIKEQPQEIKPLEPIRTIRLN